VHRSPDRVLDRSKWGSYLLPRYSPVDDHRSSCRPDRSGPGKHPRTPNGLADVTNEKSGVVGRRTTKIEANAGVRPGKGSGVLLPHSDALKGGMEPRAELQTVNDRMEAQSGSTCSRGMLLLF